ncbi:MAG: hypothetical protein H0U35_07950, partial [Sporichthyaceae bacterium]|nr:hypothetical protein [Sporichthyaceae bacterium]
RCRRHHEHKTRRLVHTVLHGDGSVDTRMLTGILVRTGPEPLPGYAPGEGYGNVTERPRPPSPSSARQPGCPAA